MWEVQELREGECACDTSLESHELYISKQIGILRHGWKIEWD
jgi:hypothetical protein